MLKWSEIYVQSVRFAGMNDELHVMKSVIMGNLRLNTVMPHLGDLMQSFVHSFAGISFIFNVLFFFSFFCEVSSVVFGFYVHLWLLKE